MRDSGRVILGAEIGHGTATHVAVARRIERGYTFVDRSSAMVLACAVS